MPRITKHKKLVEAVAKQKETVTKENGLLGIQGRATMVDGTRAWTQVEYRGDKWAISLRVGKKQDIVCVPGNNIC